MERPLRRISCQERYLEAGLAQGDVDRAVSARGSLSLDLSDLRAEGVGVVMTSIGELDMAAGVKNRRDKAGLDGPRRRTRDHNWWLAKWL